MTRQCLTLERSSPGHSWVLSTKKGNLAHWCSAHRRPLLMSTGSGPAVPHWGNSREKTLPLGLTCFLPTPRNVGEVSSLPSCLFLNKSSEVLKLCEMGEGENMTDNWARESSGESTNPGSGRGGSNQASLPSLVDWGLRESSDFLWRSAGQQEEPLPPQCSSLYQ